MLYDGRAKGVIQRAKRYFLRSEQKFCENRGQTNGRNVSEKYFGDARIFRNICDYFNVNGNPGKNIFSTKVLIFIISMDSLLTHKNSLTFFTYLSALQTFKDAGKLVGKKRKENKNPTAKRWDAQRKGLRHSSGDAPVKVGEALPSRELWQM